MNIGVAITHSATRAPDAVAVFEGERTLTFGALDERTNRLANVLLETYGIAKGDKVALLVPNRIEVVEVLGGCAKAGAVYCGLNFRLGQAEYEDIFDNAEPRLLISEPGMEELAGHLAERFSVPLLMLGEAYEDALAGASAATPPTLHDVRPADDFCIVYTSGTTGRPKGVLFTYDAVVQHAMVAVVEYELDASSRWLMALPHNSSVQITLLPLLIVGGAVGFQRGGFDARRFADEVERTGATHTYLVPTMLFRLLEAGVTPAEIETLQTIGYGAAPIPPPRVRELVERFGPRFIQLYGMAEVASIGTMLRKDDHRRAVAEGRDEIFASCGRASYAMDVRIVDDAGADVPVGERGEVIFGSPYTMTCYYRDEERTADALIDGWMHSGDIGRQDDEGYIYIVDRMKDLIIRGGFNIVPSEIENVLYAHPAVLEAAVVGVPDPEWGEALVGAVALRSGHDVATDELRDWCRAQGLQSIKVPGRIEVLETLPKNAVGKIAKRELRDGITT